LVRRRFLARPPPKRAASSKPSPGGAPTSSSRWAAGPFIRTPRPSSKASSAAMSAAACASASKASPSAAGRSSQPRSEKPVSDAMKNQALTIGCLVLCAASARAASAQQTVGDVLTFLMTNQSVATRNPQVDRSAAQATSDTISRALLANVATLPVTSSSAAFVYQLNPELGTVERATQSFGPFFVERASTAGRGQASFALTFQHLRFSSLDGHDLRDGTFVTTANQFRDESAPYDENRLMLDIDASVA